MAEGGSDRLIRAYYGSLRYRTQAFAAAAAAFDGVWLGLLDDRRLGAIDDGFYRRTRESHEGELIGYADAQFTQRGLQDWEIHVLRTHFPRAGRIVVTGAGGGREVLALLLNGYDAVGFEPNLALVEAGNRTLAQLGHGDDRLAPMDRVGWPREAGRCDGVVVGWGSLMSVPGRANRVAFLTGAAAALPAGGPVLVSGWHRDGSERTDRIVARVGTAVRRLRGAPPVELGDRLVDSFVHRFTVAELEGELTSAGLDPVESAPEPYVWAAARRR